MSQQERLDRLEQISGRVGELRSVFDRESLLRQMGAIDPGLYDEAAEEDLPDDRELEWIPFNDDATTHNHVQTAVEPLPDGLRHRLVATDDIEEDEALITCPLHNCLVVHLCEGLDIADSLERQEAAADFTRMQICFLDRWMQFHGDLPPALAALLCDFRIEAPNARAKMALWLLWVWDHCESAYWKQALAELPQPQDMPQMEFCDYDELAELQWLPYALPAGVRREALHQFYSRFCEQPIMQELGWEQLPPADPPADDAGGAAEAAEAGAASTSEPVDAGAKKGKAAKGGKGKGKGAAAEPAAAEQQPAAAPSRPLKPPPPFERFLWAYCHAEARSLGNGERVVFFPQADPMLYTLDQESINTTLAVVAEDGPILDEFAVLASLVPISKGQPLAASPPFAVGPVGGGGSTSQLHTQFGLVPQHGGSAADVVDLAPETGTIDDDWLKRLLDQEAATRLDLVTDPRLRHLLALAEAGQADMRQMPPVGEMLPPLQLPKLWGPGLVAGVKRLRLVEQVMPPSEEAEEVLRASLREDEQLAERLAAARQLDDGLAALGVAPSAAAGAPAPVSYEEYEQWVNEPSVTEIVELPADEGLRDTAEGRAEWRRMLAAWHSLPRVSPSTREHGLRMEAALKGAPLREAFSSRRDLARELAAADSLLESFHKVLAWFPTTIEEDEQLLARAAAPGAAAQGPAAAGRKSGRGRAGRRSGSASGSDSDSEGATAQAAGRAVTTLRGRGLVAWRLEYKRVWAQMAGMVEEYRDALALADAEAGPVPPEEEEAEEDEEAAAYA
ncbi:hypothetical protein GPECTOR_5g329 [Gonium pectorale]|uniref:Rubisco LSMT substrate-binding domain-containing protein n=1 Tax=Gonium pectorale TaxID=33097 RepID=A0A150GX28_GONPE|nr:hypothetical protein GPECTOR_5g329 [Gonium pectorale]|eukprot:KXZ54238.1 hypothetical protein GPECTOR_5g329 [Gonium pectorale]